MASSVVTMQSTSPQDLSLIIDALKGGISAELVAERLYDYGNLQSSLISCEKFFFRNGSYATLTIMLTKADNVMTADIIGSGGGEGIFNISWGANTDFALEAVHILKKFDFVEIN